MDCGTPEEQIVEADKAAVEMNTLRAGKKVVTAAEKEISLNTNVISGLTRRQSIPGCCRLKGNG